MNEMVDVLIIGSGASGAAVAWSLADTKMRILCLEQGDWMKQSDYPSNGRDWEARVSGDFAVSPNVRARPTDYPVNDDNSPIKVELSSHTDDRGSDEYNDKLSQRRAESAVAYIISRGIGATRITAKGYGKRELLVESAETEEDHQKNRRTEVKVTEITK